MSLSSSVFLLGAAALILSAQTNSPSPEVEQRIQRIQNNLPPAVIVEGAPPQTTKLADRMSALHVPGVSIAVIHNGAIEWARGFGVTEIGGAPVTPDTLFQAASISKPVTALAALHLVESGKLNLDTDVNQYLKTWKLPGNEFTAKTKVTLRQLLTHTAGMTVHGFPGYASGEPVPTLVQVLNGEKPANTPAIRVDTAPGTVWNYSGGGYVIAQQLLMDVTGKPFPQLMQELVLKSIGMTRSTYEQPLPAARLTETATPYRPDGQPIVGGPHTYPEMAPAGLWTTASDLARYAIEVQNALAGKSNRVISAAVARQMLTPGLNQQGLGPMTGGGKDNPFFTHGGANEGYRCEFVAYDNGDGAVVMTNSDSGGMLAEEIIRAIAYEYQWPDFQPARRTISKVDPKTLDKYLGAYQLAPGAVMTVTRDGEHLYGQITGQPRLELFAMNEREFFPKEVPAQLIFEVGADGKATQLILRQNGINRPAPRMNDAEAKQLADFQATLTKRFQDQTQDPRTEPALRRVIEEVRRGQPDYDQMTPQFAEVTRQQLPQLQTAMMQHGAIQSVTFKGVGPAGADIYEVKFENGGVEIRILLGPDGKIQTLGYRNL
jgi:CubicO group peptidase (beta-lactamase class C family)